jgi:HK97 family phage portal protein
MFAAHDIRAQAAPGPADDFWYTQLVPKTAAGARVNATTAMQLSTVYKCVKAIAETVAMLPLPVYRRLAKGKDRAPEHPLAKLLRNPNPWQTAMQWREMMQGHACLRGNGYSEIVFDGAGRPEMLVPQHPDRVKVEVTASGMPRYRVTDEQGDERVLVFGEVFHLQGFAVDGYVGLNPIEAEREAIGAAIVTRDYGSRYFSNSARPPTWIENPGKFRDDVARRKWAAEYQAAYGGQNAGKSPVLEGGMKIHELTISNKDAQWLDLRNAQDIDIAGIFRVPPHKIGILSEAKWANIEHQQIDWVTDSVMPWCVRWEQTIARDLLLDDERYFVEHVIDMLLRGDTKSRYEAYGKGIQDGWLTRNEAREKENLNPIDGLDTPLEPMNMAPAGSRRASQERGQSADARTQSIRTAAAERVARKEAAELQRAMRADVVSGAIAKLYDGHEHFVSEVMAVPLRVARAYCQEAANHLVVLHDEGQLGELSLDDWTTRQVAALLRLEP